MIVNRTGTGLAILFAVSALQGCDFPQACSLGVEPAIVVTVVDASTGAPLAENAVGVLRRHGVVDTLVPYAFDDAGHLTSLQSPAIGAGTYDVIITLQGYDTWVEKALVLRGDCGFATQASTARLERTSAP